MAIVSPCNMFAALFCLLYVISSTECQYQPNWKSIDSRPLPAWYDQSKIGIFIHWGVFSVPSFTSEWFWYYWKGPKPVPYVVKFMQDNYRPDFTYADFASQFTAEFFNPDQWADIFAASGARYVVFVTKHHEGFTNWPSKVSFNWNSMDVGPKRDIVGELTNAVRKKTDLHMGFYHSLFEWFNPLYDADLANNFTTQDYVRSKAMPELYELVNTYKPDIIWSDGIGTGIYANSTYWNSTHFLAWLYNESPVKDKVVTNDRWGKDAMCKHGGFYTCRDRYNPGTLQKHKWENCLTLDKGSWGYRREAQLSSILTMEELTKTIAETISCGGNVLINVGPTHDGRIVPVFEERLRQLGQWLKVTGEAIYESVPWTFQNDTLTPNVWYTQKKTAMPAVYAFVLDWPKGRVLGLDAPKVSTSTQISLLGYPKPLTFMPSPIGSGVMIDIPKIGFNEMPCELTNAIRKKTDLHMGIYHSMFEWFNPVFNADKANNFTTQDFVKSKTMPELYELVKAYKPDIIWSDGAPVDSSYWNSTHFLAWLYNESPVKDTVVTNDRWGSDTACKHGGFFTCSDRYNPGKLQNHKWENCLTLDKSSWGYRRNAQLSDYMTMKELTKTIAESISCGGNVLINVGPTHDGRIVPVFEERLRQLGQWLKVTGEAVYESVPWTFQNDTLTPNVWYTQKKTAMPAVYAFVLDWPKGSVLGLDSPKVSTSTQISLLGYPKPLTFKPSPTGSGVMIDIPKIGFNEMPCDYAWVFKMTSLEN